MYHCSRGPEDLSAQTAAAVAACKAGDGKGGKKGKSIKVGCQARFTVTVHKATPQHATVAYNVVAHSGHDGEMAEHLNRAAQSFVQSLLRRQPDMSAAEVHHLNLERFFKPVRAEHPEWSEKQIREHLEESDDLPRDFYLEHKDIDNIRQVRAAALRPVPVLPRAWVQWTYSLCTPGKNTLGAPANVQLPGVGAREAQAQPGWERGGVGESATGNKQR